MGAVLNLGEKMNKLFFKALAFLITVSVSGLVSAKEAAQEAKFAVIDYDKVFAKEQIAQKHIKDLEGKEKAILSAEEKARTDIEKKMGEFQASMPKLSDKAKQDKETSLRTEISTLQQQFTQKREDLLKEREKVVADLEAVNRVILNEVMEEKGLTAVFKSAALAGSKLPDISDEVGERCNKAHPVKAETKKGKDKAKK